MYVFITVPSFQEIKNKLIAMDEVLNKKIDDQANENAVLKSKVKFIEQASNFTIC